MPPELEAFGPMNLRGRDGLSIDDAWAKGPRTWGMTAIPGFPNLFTVFGPNSPTGVMSMQLVAELTARYITGWLRRFRDGEITTLEITEEATSRFIALGYPVYHDAWPAWAVLLIAGPRVMGARRVSDFSRADR